MRLYTICVLLPTCYLIVTWLLPDCYLIVIWLFSDCYLRASPRACFLLAGPLTARTKLMFCGCHAIVLGWSCPGRPYRIVPVGWFLALLRPWVEQLSTCMHVRRTDLRYWTLWPLLARSMRDMFIRGPDDVVAACAEHPHWSKQLETHERSHWSDYLRKLLRHGNV